MRKTTCKIPACKQNTNKCSKLCSFSLAPAKMSVWDARHWRERMLMLFIAHGWLPLPLHLRSSQSLMYSFSQQLSEAEDSLPRAVLEELGFAWGKRTVTFVASSQTVYYKLPPAGTTSSKAAASPATRAWLSPPRAMGLQLCWRLFLPPPSCQLCHPSTVHTKPRKETSSGKQQHKTWQHKGEKNPAGT